MKVKVSYDGRVTVTPHSVSLGERTVEEILHGALGLDDDKYQVLNAEVEIFVNIKPDEPTIWVEENEEC